ncbi:MAG: hypothetical protein PHR06_08370 [Candidatus Cloacimonetes bacterium]|nr:hypothetical protein [Candidatus Cloacimonadota bacterium]
MRDIEIMEISCPLVDGSLMPFYEKESTDNFFDVSAILSYLKNLDLTIKGKIDIRENTKYLVEELLGTDDFGAPPRSLFIKFNLNNEMHYISIPYGKDHFIYFEKCNL